MKHLHERDEQLEVAVAAKNTAHVSGDLDAYSASHRQIKELSGLPNDHELLKYRCPCGARFSSGGIYLCYISGFDIGELGVEPVNFYRAVERGQEHHIAFCPDCAINIRQHHFARPPIKEGE